MRFSFKQTKFAAAAMTALALLLATAAQVKADFANGGFETGDFSGWILSGNITTTSGVFSGANAGYSGAHSGTYYALLGPVGSLGYLGQNLATTPGDAYTVTFYLAFNGTTAPNDLVTVVEGGTLGGSQDTFEGGTRYSGTVTGGTTIFGPVSYSASASFPYTQETTASFTATNPTTFIALGFRDDPNFFALDDVSYGPSGPATAPEPSSFILLGVGAAGLLGYAGLRRRMQPVPVA